MNGFYMQQEGVLYSKCFVANDAATRIAFELAAFVVYYFFMAAFFDVFMDIFYMMFKVMFSKKCRVTNGTLEIFNVFMNKLLLKLKFSDFFMDSLDMM